MIFHTIISLQFHSLFPRPNTSFCDKPYWKDNENFRKGITLYISMIIRSVTPTHCGTYDVQSPDIRNGNLATKVFSWNKNVELHNHHLRWQRKSSQQKYSIHKMSNTSKSLSETKSYVPYYLTWIYCSFYIRELLPLVHVTHSSQEVRCSVWRVCLDSIIPGISDTEKNISRAFEVYYRMYRYISPYI